MKNSEQQINEIARQSINKITLSEQEHTDSLIQRIEDGDITTNELIRELKVKKMMLNKIEVLSN